jgi:hypothetical protein
VGRGAVGGSDESGPDVTPAQCRAARGLLDITAGSLAQSAHIPASAVMNFERGLAMQNQANVNAIGKAFEEAGVEFIDGERPRVRLRKSGS